MNRDEYIGVGKDSSDTGPISCCINHFEQLETLIVRANNIIT
ncbi:hypothetical protein [Nonlabens sp.]